MITTLLVTKNNQNEIINTLNSINDFGPIIIADLGSDDNTVELCKKRGATVYKTELKNDYSVVRNTLAAKVTTEWMFWLEPGEEVISGGEYLTDLSHDMYRVMSVQGDLLTKPPRIYRKGKASYRHPAFEEVEDKAEKTLPIIIGGTPKQDMQSILGCLLHWKNTSPLDPEPNYYIACHHLMTKNYTMFLNLAEHYLFQKKEIDSSTVMTRYYMALLLKNKIPDKALQLTLECIAAYPLMAEFWCLLGDLYLTQIKQPDKAYMFYDNAKILGSRRLAEDTMPMEISKYDDYPTKMMEGVLEIILRLENSRSQQSQHTP